MSFIRYIRVLNIIKIEQMYIELLFLLKIFFVSTPSFTHYCDHQETLFDLILPPQPKKSTVTVARKTNARSRKNVLPKLSFIKPK
jgi:hypothetical protein